MLRRARARALLCGATYLELHRCVLHRLGPIMPRMHMRDQCRVGRHVGVMSLGRQPPLCEHHVPAPNDTCWAHSP